jgi:hypothetical protein
MRGKTAAGIALAASLAMATGALAVPPGAAPRSSQQRMLADVRNEVAAQANLAGKGAAQQRYELERRRLDDLIERLQSGHSVSSAEIDRAVDSALTAP